MDGTKSIPRMRTAAKIVAEIKALDPDTEVTEFHIRKRARMALSPWYGPGARHLSTWMMFWSSCGWGQPGPPRRQPQPWEVSGALIQNVKEVPMKKKFTFEDYREALEGVGPKTRENILARAEQDENIEFPDFVRLCKLAYPEPA